jgi:ribosomal protein L6P/L9E
MDKQLVGQVARTSARSAKPEPHKRKASATAGEVVRMKAARRVRPLAVKK